jgi:type VI secretion system protein ImpH
VKAAPRSVYARLLAEPRRFRFDAAARILSRIARTSDLTQAVRFRTPPGLAYPAAEVSAVDQAPHQRPFPVTTPVMGLTGAAGVLPRPYTEMLTQTLRRHSAALHDFLDGLSHGFVAFFARAGVKYRLSRSAETAAQAEPPRPDPISEALLALTGYATPHLIERLRVGASPLLHYAGLFTSRPRSAEKLAAMVSDWLGGQVEVVQFVGSWLPIPPDQRTTLARGLSPGSWNRLGVDASIGVRAWDLQSSIILRVSPLDRAAFERLLPDRPDAQQLVSLVRAFLGFEIGFAINPVLAASEVPRLGLGTGGSAPPRLGWNTWVEPPKIPMIPLRRVDAADAVFSAQLIEAEERSARDAN